MKQLIFKCADDALFNVSRAADAEYVVKQLREIKNLKGYACVATMLQDTAKTLLDLELRVSRMYVDDDRIILFVEAPDWFDKETKYRLYDKIRENLCEISNNFSIAIKHYT